MGIHYRHPKLYNFLISFLYSKKLLKEFLKEVGEKHTIFDVAAGYGRMSKFIHPSNSYYGIDLNKKFVEYGRRQGINLVRKDILDFSAYIKHDVFVVVDIIHHLTSENIKKLFGSIFVHAAKKVIIIEPAFLNFTDRHPVFGRCIDWLFKKIDDDGFNKITKWFSPREYEAMFKNHFDCYHANAFSVEYRRFGLHYLAVFTRT